MDYHPLTEANLNAVYGLFLRNEPFYSIPFEYFKRGTIEDEDYDPDLTLVLFNSENNDPIATLIAIKRAEIFCIKAIIVDKSVRRQGIARSMLKEIIVRAKTKANNVSSISYGDCPPNYWQPGVDLRHTDLFFFLKKNGFKLKEIRQNLTVDLKELELNPLTVKDGYFYDRVQPKDFVNVYNFVKDNYGISTWPEEVQYSFRNIPPTTFIARNNNSEIVGWATHNVQFPGSFGPTGVLYSLQGQGIGTELLKWCLWDIKQSGLDVSTIMWVVGNTIKFYSKSIGAYIHPLFYVMTKKLRN
jgi:GNAT superfamily N-acetyltransferase